MTNAYIKKVSCRSCKSPELKSILNLGNFYLSEFYKSKKRPKKYPLDLVLCAKCYLLQLKYTTPQTELYTPRYGYKSGINNTMRLELQNIVNDGLKLIKNPKSLMVVDIGTNDGTLLKNYPKRHYRIAVEPIKKLAKEAKKYSNLVINDYFNYISFNKKTGNRKADIVTIISCFYDIDDPNKFIKDLIKILHKNSIVIVQQNYLGEMLKQNAFDNIVHEHLAYYSLLSFENLLKKHGLSIFDVKINTTNGGSFRTYISFNGERDISPRVKLLRKKEKKMKLDKIKTYTEFANRVSKIGLSLNNFIVKERNKGKNFYIYGASTRGNTLIQYFKLNNKLISKAVERNPEKWGKYISSVGIPIISEKQARKERPNYMIVLPWFFKDEFLEREKNYLKRGGHFIFPLPRLVII